MMAFGEKISGANHRFGYVGEFGYQTHSDLPYQHVGHRYYDPTTGRFLQRDPIGILGSPNVYAYVDNVPSVYLDPDGLDLITSLPGILKKGATVGKKIAEDLMGKSSPWGKLNRPIGLGADAMQCVPDLIRIKKAADHRRELIDSEDDINDALDKYDKGHKGNVKPGKG